MLNSSDVKKILAGIKDPSFIIDSEGRIISSNEPAKGLFPSHLAPELLFDQFSAENTAILRRMLSDCIFLHKAISERSDIVLPDLGHRKAEILFSPFESEDRKIVVLCTFYFDENNENTEIVKIKISTREIEQILKDEKALKILDEVRSSFPFTFLGKTRIQSAIDKLDEFFWIKDTEGKYLLVNSRFAGHLGLKTAQVEGCNEVDFLPKYLIELYSTFRRFITSTTNLIVHESFPFSSSGHRQSQIIEIPLCDLDNKVIAILGISQSHTEPATNSRDKGSLAEFAIPNLDTAALITDENGIVKYKSRKFSRLLKTEDLPAGLHCTEYLPEDLSSAVEQFVNSRTSEEINVNTSETNDNRDSFVFNFRKIYNNEGKLEGYLISLKEEKSKLDQNNIIKDRGKMYDILMQTSPEPMFIYDIENLRFLEVNQAALQVYGYSQNEFLQMDLTDLYAPEDIQTLLDSSKPRNKEGIFTGPWRHKKKDGSNVLVEISKSAFEYKGRKAHFNIIKDVTEKVRLGNDILFLKMLFDNSSDLLLSTDEEGFIIKANDSALKFLGYSKSDLENRPILSLVSDKHRAELNNLVLHSRSDKTVNLGVELKKKDGSVCRAELTATPVMNYNEQVTAFNIIAKPKLKTNESIEIPQIESAANRSAETIDPGFLSSMFHEILTPMNVILGFIQEITDNIEKPTEEQQEAIDIISQNRTLLMQTMDSVLEYSHIEQNRIEVSPQRIFFSEIVDDLQKSVKKIIDERKITFNYGKISTSLSLETDRHRLESLLSMFIQMVVRITKEKDVFLSAYQFDENNCIISLKDRRSAVTPYLMENLTELFTRNEKDIKKNFGISKLTLRLARKLLNILGAKVEVVYRSGEPVEFGFLFPLNYRKPLEHEDTKGQDQSRKTIRTGNGEVSAEKNRAKSDEDTADDYILRHPRESGQNGLTDRDDRSDRDIERTIKTDRHVETEKKEDQEQWNIARIKEEIMAGTQDQSRKTTPGLNISQLKCLYVEDQVDSQILFKVQMKDLKKVDFAVSFESALPLLEQNKYDFIIMDINLQGEYNGLDALRIIRRLPGYEHIPVLAVTAYVLAGDKEKFVAAGFNGFVSKPIMREKVITSLEKLI